MKKPTAQFQQRLQEQKEQLNIELVLFGDYLTLVEHQRFWNFVNFLKQRKESYANNT